MSINIRLKPTPLQSYPELAARLGLEHLLIKREDLNPSGSHKDRAIWPMFDYYHGQGINGFVISSSGNAAISAAYFMNEKIGLQELTAVRSSRHRKIKFFIFVSRNMPTDKRQRLDELLEKSGNIAVYESVKAKSDAIKFAKQSNYQLIRTSTDDLALAGYRELAGELITQLEQVSLDKSDQTGIDQGSGRRRTPAGKYDIFIPTSSGTLLQGLYEGCKQPKTHRTIRAKGPMSLRFHIAQTARVNTISREFDQDFKPAKSSLASAIVDTIGHRKAQVVKAAKESGGSGWVVSDEELKKARSLFEHSLSGDIGAEEIGAGKIDAKNTPSWDSLLSLAGLTKALSKGVQIKQAVLFFTGK